MFLGEEDEKKSLEPAGQAIPIARVRSLFYFFKFLFYPKLLVPSK